MLNVRSDETATEMRTDMAGGIAPTDQGAPRPPRQDRAGLLGSVEMLRERSHKGRGERHPRITPREEPLEADDVVVKKNLSSADDVLDRGLVLESAERRLTGQVAIGAEPATSRPEEQIGTPSQEVAAVLVSLKDWIDAAADEILEREDNRRGITWVLERGRRAFGQPEPVIHLPYQRKAGITSDGSPTGCDAEGLCGARELGLRGGLAHAELLCLVGQRPTNSGQLQFHPYPRYRYDTLMARPQRRE